MSNDNMDTKPTIETVLERINELGNRLSGEIQALRVDMEKGFRNLERRLDVVSVDINRVRADIHDHESRINTVEENLKPASPHPQG